jgi:hypothetical protein
VQHLNAKPSASQFLHLDKDIHRALGDKFSEDLVFKTTICSKREAPGVEALSQDHIRAYPGDQASLQYSVLLKEMLNREGKSAFNATLNPLPAADALGRIAPDDGLDELDVGSVVNG